jgi:exonuclease III
MEDKRVTKTKKNVKDSFILGQVLGSDHCPVGIELDLDRTGEN